MGGVGERTVFAVLSQAKVESNVTIRVAICAVGMDQMCDLEWMHQLSTTQGTYMAPCRFILASVNTETTTRALCLQIRAELTSEHRRESGKRLLEVVNSAG